MKGAVQCSAVRVSSCCVHCGTRGGDLMMWEFGIGRRRAAVAGCAEVREEDGG